MSRRKEPDDLSGGCRAPRRFVDWPTFFDFSDGNARPNKKIDSNLSTSLFRLPVSVVANPDPKTNPASLAQRNLLRHLTFSLPSGQRVARAMKLPELSKGDLAHLKPHGFDDRTPLWFYILREAQVAENGERLGPVRCADRDRGLPGAAAGRQGQLSVARSRMVAVPAHGRCVEDGRRFPDDRPVSLC